MERSSRNVSHVPENPAVIQGSVAGISEAIFHNEDFVIGHNG